MHALYFLLHRISPPSDGTNISESNTKIFHFIVFTVPYALCQVTLNKKKKKKRAGWRGGLILTLIFWKSSLRILTQTSTILTDIFLLRFEVFTAGDYEECRLLGCGAV
jgi:hypothetical protein